MYACNEIEKLMKGGIDQSTFREARQTSIRQTQFEIRLLKFYYEISLASRTKSDLSLHECAVRYFFFFFLHLRVRGVLFKIYSLDVTTNFAIFSPGSRELIAAVLAHGFY